MLRLVTVCRPAKAFNFYSGHPDVCSAIITNQKKISKTIKASLFFIFQSFFLENQDESRHVHNIDVVNMKEGETLQFMKKGLPNFVTVRLELVDPAV